MEKFIKEKWFKVGLLAVLIISIAGWFYWYQWRPSQIIKACEKEAEDLSLVDLRNLSDFNIQNGIIADTKTGDEQYNGYYTIRYQKCLRKNGL